MNNDNLKNSLASFIAWRKVKDNRAKVTTRAGMLAFHGKNWVMSEDHKRAFFHAVEDFAAPEWDSGKDASRRTGLYADYFANNTIYWAVVKIAPANKKHSRPALYAPITYGTDFEGVTLRLDCAGSREDAIRWGESCAEKLAEEAREYDAKFQAEQQIAAARDSIHSLNVKALPLIRAIKESAPFKPVICEALHERLTEYLVDRAKEFERIATLQDDYWKAVQ